MSTLEATLISSPQQLWNKAARLFTAEGAHPDRLDFIARLSPYSAAAHMINAAFVVSYLWPEQPRVSLLAWLAAVALAAGGILLHGRRGSGRRLTRISRRMMRRANLFSAIVALPWGMVACYAPFFVSPERQGLLAIVVVGMGAGGAIILASLPSAALIYTLVMAAPLAIGQLHVFTIDSILFTACVSSYVALLALFSITYTQMLQKQEQAQEEMRQTVERLQAANLAIDAMARSDVLSGLMNRRALREAMETLFAEPPPQGLVRPLFVIDLDHFKAINDARGHAVGDRYLVTIAERLSQIAPAEALVARLGGDEFAVVLAEPVEPARVEQFAATLLERLSRSVRVDAWELKAGCSIGVAMAPIHSNDPVELMTYADDALLAAKESGRAGVRMFDAMRRDAMLNQAADASLLMLAIARREIAVAYQPQVRLSDGVRVGFEALARWRHPSRGDVSPLEFFQLAEDNGMILDLSRAILERIRVDLTAWAEQGLDFGRVAINLHPSHLSHPQDLQEGLGRLRAICGARRLTLEVTENCVIGRGTEEIPGLLRELSAMGHAISLDDFGTGFASLSHLTELPIDEVKVDRKFVSKTENGMPDMTIVAAICDMARPRGQRVVIEGVETQEQRAALLELGEVEAQGWLFGKPIQAVDIPALLRQSVERAA